MILFVLLFALLAPGLSHAACSGSGITWSCTAGTTQAEVNTAISSASDGATLTFAAGAYTWTSSAINFSLTKAITLACATEWACDVTLGAFAIGYPTGNSMKLMRLTGFDFTPTASFAIAGCPGGSCSATLLESVRIDHNRFTDTGNDRTMIILGESGATSYFMEGVIDHNTVNCTNSCYLLQAINNNNTPASRKLGSVHNMFLEDNTITITNMTNNGTGCLDGWGGHGLVFRFNTAYNCRAVVHGVGSGHFWGPINYEAYGNIIQMNNTDSFIKDCTRCLHHQGSGTAMYWDNVLIQSPGEPHSSSPIVTLHYRSDITPNSGTGLCTGLNVSDGDGNRAPTATYEGYPCFRQPGRDIDGVLFPVFSWKNRWNDDGAMASLVCNGAAPTCTKHVLFNRDLYQAVSANAQTSSSSPFNGTAGMGFGTLANRPTTCTIGPDSDTGEPDVGKSGVGYWATDQGSWNQSTSNPYGVQRNGEDGVLYMCTATNTWMVQYVPYIYPHPLNTSSGGGGGGGGGGGLDFGQLDRSLLAMRREDD